MFIQIHHALRTDKGRRIQISDPVHAEITLWHHLVTSLAARPAHLREIRPNPPTWIGTTYVSLTGMGIVCYSHSGEWHVWRQTFSTAIQANTLTDENTQGFLTINDLDLAA